MNILVLCTGNSARSILLEAFFNKAVDGRVKVWSAGSQPAGNVHRHSLKLLKEKGYPTGYLRSKSWDEFSGPDAPEMDIVITVCGSAAGESCPMWAGKPLRAHWGVDDPAAADLDDQPKAFLKAWEILTGRARMFLSLPLESMSASDLQTALVKIGQT
jgi:protein-tyrosine-phosphatase